MNRSDYNTKAVFRPGVMRATVCVSEVGVDSAIPLPKSRVSWDHATEGGRRSRSAGKPCSFRPFIPAIAHKLLLRAPAAVRRGPWPMSVRTANTTLRRPTSPATTMRVSSTSTRRTSIRSITEPVPGLAPCAASSICRLLFHQTRLSTARRSRLPERGIGAACPEQRRCRQTLQNFERQTNQGLRRSSSL